MFELTINGEVYNFKFGIGFVKDMNKSMQVTLSNGVKADAGLEYVMGQMYDGDVLALIEVLDTANKYAPAPRVTKKSLEEFIEDENTDIDELFKTVIDFFGKSNATKKKANALVEEIKKQMEMKQ